MEMVDVRREDSTVGMINMVDLNLMRKGGLTTKQLLVQYIKTCTCIHIGMHVHTNGGMESCKRELLYVHMYASLRKSIYTQYINRHVSYT